ncbi:MAG: cation transporter [Nitrososphaerota archaeon]|nr:cation transporter [Nitrososphaerota archaeon]
MQPWRGRVSTGLFQVPNLDRPGCARSVSSSLKGMDGVLKVGINSVTDNVYVSYDPLLLAREQIRRAIADASRSFDVQTRRPGSRGTS